MGNLVFVLLLFSSAPDDPPAVARPTPAERFQAIRREHEALFRDHLDATRKAKNADERAARADLYQSRLSNLAERALQLARTNPKDPAAVDALGWVVRTQKVGRGLGRALDMLARDHLDSPKLTEACRDAAHTPPNAFGPAEGLLRAALEKSPHREVRGVATFNLADHLRERAEMALRMEEEPEEVEHIRTTFNFTHESFAAFRARSHAELIKEAEALYETTVSTFADIPSRVRGVTIGKLAEARLFQIRNLSVGCTVPQIAAKDHEGNELKLSDQRGKVVVLIFSGTWSAPSRKIYPHQRAMVERLKSKPFVMLGFNADRSPEALQKSMDLGDVTWRCWREDGPFSPTLLRWGIDRYPTIFVIDAQGKIRHRDPHEDQLDKLVDDLLKETEAAK